MKCLQVFLPFLSGGLGSPVAARDMARAVRSWDGEDRIWLLPGIERPVLWSETWGSRKAWLRAVPAEELNSVDVYHVGENGYVYGPPEFDRFPDGRIDRLLDAWLTWVAVPTIRWQAPPRVTLDVPRFIDTEVVYDLVELEPAPGPSSPMETGRAGEILLRRPDRPAAAISPETELTEYFRERFGALHRTEIDGVEIWVSDLDPTFRSLPVTLWADPPLTGYFPTGVNLDAVHHWAKMSSVVKQSAHDLAAALRRATELSSTYVTDGFSTRGHTWFMPTLAELRDIQLVIGRAASLRLNDARTWTDVGKSERWQKVMTEQIPVRRAWGPIGLFWALILQRLESGKPFQVCERCGKPLAGSRHKRFCDRGESSECFLARRAQDRRRERRGHAGDASTTGRV